MCDEVATITLGVLLQHSTFTRDVIPEGTQTGRCECGARVSIAASHAAHVADEVADELSDSHPCRCEYGWE